MSKTFTTADADRLLGLGDQHIEDWEIDAKESGGDPEYTERCAEWNAIRPLLVQAPALLSALKDLLGDRPQVQGGVCQACGRDYIGEMLEGDCPAEDCPAFIASAAIAKAEGRTVGEAA